MEDLWLEVFQHQLVERAPSNARRDALLVDGTSVSSAPPPGGWEQSRRRYGAVLAVCGSDRTRRRGEPRPHLHSYDHHPSSRRNTARPRAKRTMTPKLSPIADIASRCAASLRRSQQITPTVSDTGGSQDSLSPLLVGLSQDSRRHTCCPTQPVLMSFPLFTPVRWR